MQLCGVSLLVSLSKCDCSKFVSKASIPPFNFLCSAAGEGHELINMTTSIQVKYHGLCSYYIIIII